MNTIKYLSFHFLLPIAAAALLFVGCDKIDSNEYTVYDGAVITWAPSTKAIETVQRAYVEKYTGPQCNNCPKADQTLAAIHNERVVIVSINHPTGQGQPFPGDPDMRTDGGTTWDRYFGINAIPAAYINRNTDASPYLGEMANIVSGIDQALAQSPTITMEAGATTMGNGDISISVQLQYVKKYSEPVTLTVVLVEDSLIYKQLLPDGTIDEEYAHDHMLREVITGFWGREVEAKGIEGENILGSLSFTPDSNIKLENSHIVAFISNKATRKVLNCASCKINSNS